MRLYSTVLIRNAAVGTSIPTMHIGLLNKVPIPDLEASVSKSIRENIAAAVRARADAHEAESEAVRIIEEEVLPEWLG